MIQKKTQLNGGAVPQQNNFFFNKQLKKSTKNVSKHKKESHVQLKHGNEYSDKTKTYAESSFISLLEEQCR